MFSLFIFDVSTLFTNAIFNNINTKFNHCYELGKILYLVREQKHLYE